MLDQFSDDFILPDQLLAKLLDLVLKVILSASLFRLKC